MKSSVMPLSTRWSIAEVRIDIKGGPGDGNSTEVIGYLPMDTVSPSRKAAMEAGLVFMLVCDIRRVHGVGV